MDFFCNICYFNRFLVIEESYLGIFRKFSEPYRKTFRSGRKKISLVTEKKQVSGYRLAMTDDSYGSELTKSAPKRKIISFGEKIFFPRGETKKAPFS